MSIPFPDHLFIVPFGVTYENIGTIQRRLAWPLHKDDTLFQSGSSTELNIYFVFILLMEFEYYIFEQFFGPISLKSTLTFLPLLSFYPLYPA
ncbi:hypothetical protein GYMLUDRAFT_152722 [Collybiopsis luxurians FD-317 M1]|nr:hypothetical protein GYMLUDRAFT_152722 [Collybiopsis luxurians FD-317 M1]